MARSRWFHLQFESLEERCVLDGTVEIALSGNRLTIIGDEVSNSLTLTRDGDILHIVGNNTMVRLNGGQAVAQKDLTIADYSKLEVKFNLKGGDDVVEFGKIGGADIVVKTLKVETGRGVDSFQAVNLDVSGGRRTDILLAQSGNETDNDRFGAIHSKFQGSLKLRTGSGDDFAGLGEASHVGGKLDVNLGEGNDGFELFNSTFSLFDVRLGAGDDSVNLYKSQSQSSKGRSTLDTGTGNDNVTISQLALVHDFKINLEPSSQLGNNRITATDLTIGRGLQLNGGNGLDTINATTIMAAETTIRSRGNADAIEAKFIQSSKLTLDTGAGNDTVLAQVIKVTDKATLDGGRDTDTLTFELSTSTVPPGTNPQNFETKTIT